MQNEMQITFPQYNEILQELKSALLIATENGEKLNARIDEIVKAIAVSNESIRAHIDASYSDGGDFTKDIKDVDQVAFNDDFDRNLYNCARELEIYLDNNGQEQLANKAIFKHVKDYDVKKGLSDAAYQLLIKELTSKCHVCDLYGYMDIRSRYGIGARIQDNPKGF